MEREGGREGGMEGGREGGREGGKGDRGDERERGSRSRISAGRITFQRSVLRDAFQSMKKRGFLALSPRLCDI